MGRFRIAAFCFSVALVTVLASAGSADESIVTIQKIENGTNTFVKRSTEDGAKAGVTFENMSETEPLVVLRYFGPEVNPEAPAMGAYRKNKF